MNAALRMGVRFCARYWSFFALAFAWQAWVSFAHVSRIVAPAPLAVLRELLAHPQPYVREGAATLAVAAAGLCCGTALAFVIAVATWFSPLATAALSWPALLVQSTPVVALMPVLARAFGYDWKTVVAATTLIAFFPAFVLIAAGLRDVPRGASDVFVALGARRLARLRFLALPSAVPGMLVALRLSTANCVLAALVAEYLMGTAGLGRLFAVAVSSFDLPSAWAACLVATFLSVGGYLAAARFERYALERYRA